MLQPRDDVDHRSSVNGLFNRLVTDMAEDEDRIRRSIDHKVTRRIGGDGMATAFDLDAGPGLVDAFPEADRSSHFHFAATGIGQEGITGCRADVGHRIADG